MQKKYMNWALLYAVLAMVCGVFYREFTKFLAFEGITALRVMHTHYFVLGTFFFLVLLLMERSFAFSDARGVKPALVCYHVGLNLAQLCFLGRGILQVLGTPLSNALNASISGVAGIGHILLGVGMLVVLVRLRQGVARAN